MDTVAQSAADAELHLLTDWRDPSRGDRTRKAAIFSVLVHVAVLAALAFLPESAFFSSPPPVETAEVRKVVTPLIEPLTELTQKPPTKGKINKEFNATELRPRPNIQIPAGPPSSTRPKAALPAPPVPTPKPVQPAPLPEPPKVEAAVKQSPKPVLPPAPLPAPPPQIQPEEKPKSPFEDVAGPPHPTQGTKAAPSVAEAIRRAETGRAQGGLMVGDEGASGPGGYGVGMNLPPSPGSQGSNLQLLSDPLGVDFRPYLIQILATVKRNWFAILPESVKLGRRGKVAIQFSISRDGKVPKLVIAAASGTEALDRAAVAAISASNPFPPLPGEFKGDRVVLQFNFAYNMPRQ
jgi:TonB family protein